MTDALKNSIASANTKSSNMKPQLNLMEGDDLNDISTAKINGLEYVVERTPEGRSEGIVKDMPLLSPMSQKKLNFKQRLESKRNGETVSLAGPAGLPVVAYQSVKPEQEMVMQPGKGMNLLLDDSLLN